MEETGSYIEQNVNGNIQRDYLFTYSEEEKQQNEINRENAKLAFNFKYLTIPADLFKLGLSSNEVIILAFIHSWLCEDSQRFYFTNEQISQIFNIDVSTVSRILKNLKEKDLIDIGYKRKSNGGQIRFCNLMTRQNAKLLLGKMQSSYFAKCNGNIYNISNHKKTSSNVQFEPEIESQFNSLWEKYPKRQKRKEAYRHFCKEYKKDNKIADRILVSLNNYLKHIEANRTEAQYIMMGSTFFYNWSDWETPPSSAAPPKSAFQIELERLKGASNERDI